MPGGSFQASSLDAVNNAVSALWREEFAEAQNNLPYQGVVTDLGSTKHKARQIDFMGNTGEMQDLTRAGLDVDGVERYTHTLTHVEYGRGLDVRIADLDTDNLGQLPGRIAGMARKAAGHPWRLMFDRLESNGNAHDSTALFADTRTNANSVSSIDNALAGTGTSASAIETDLQTARAAMARFTDDQSEAMEMVPDTLIIPVDLGGVFAKVLGGYRDPGGTTTQVGAVSPGRGNSWSAGGYNVIELARLSDTDNWYALHTGGDVRPWLYSWVRQPGVLNTPSLNDATAVNHAFLRYAVYGNYVVGESLPHYFIRTTN